MPDLGDFGVMRVELLEELGIFPIVVVAVIVDGVFDIVESSSSLLFGVLEDDVGVGRHEIIGGVPPPTTSSPRSFPTVIISSSSLLSLKSFSP